MNFFAHALVALRRRADPLWLLGAMAPDFASMAGVRLARLEGEGALAAGIAFHHRTDEAFHGAPRFVSLMKSAREDLQARGLGLGPALGISHVGVELLLDGALVRSAGVPEAYRAALREARGATDSLAFRGADAGAARGQWLRFCDRIEGAPVPEGYAQTEFVAERLIGIMARRPRLAVEHGREGEVFAWAAAAAPEVAAARTALLEEVEARLADRAS